MLPDYLLSQLHPNTKGVDKQTSVNSSKKVWWVCDKGHEWETQIRKRAINQHGCPICGNKQLLTGFNDLATTHPELTEQWHPTLNNIIPQSVFSGTKQKAWWICDKGHEWEASIKNRAKLKQGCPVCKNKKVSINFNDLATTHPELTEQWHPTLNNNVSPNDIVSGSDFNAWWQCKLGHEWETKVSARKRYNTQCPTCSGKKTLSGFNDLASTNMVFINEWHPTKNSFSPQEITPGSGMKVWWICEKGHEWGARISDRKSHGCPACGTRISNAENELHLFLQKYYDKVIMTSTRSVIPPLELDFWLPEKQIAIEFNGLYWHSEKYRSSTYHYDKWLACKEKGIQLIQIWEDDWNRKPMLIKQMLLHKLGLRSNYTNKVYARDTFISYLSKQETDEFLNLNHIQGTANGSLRIGLRNKATQELVAVIVLKQEKEKTLNLVRFATTGIVPGGFSKILKYVEEFYEPTKIITFSDNLVSDGSLYDKNGFTAEKLIKPDYFYIYRGKREHKFNFRLKRFKNDDILKYQINLTEKELAILNDIPRIWDAGKIKWVKIKMVRWQSGNCE